MFRHILVSLMAVGCIGAATLADEPVEKPKAAAVQGPPVDIAKYLQEISVTVKTNRGSGSGVLFASSDGQVWVWTAGHVVESCRRVEQRVDSTTGAMKHMIDFDDLKIVKIDIDPIEGRVVGKQEFDAEVIRYSGIDSGHDIALLRIRKKDLKVTSTLFYLEKDIPTRGVKLFHCGSLLGQEGAQSMTSGIVSQLGRLIDKKVYDQSTCPAFPGSSGGPICLEDGRYIGMLVRGAGETFNFYIPVRRMKDWAQKTGVEFALDASLPVPTDEVLKSKPIEDGAGFKVFPVQDAAKPATKLNTLFKEDE